MFSFDLSSKSGILIFTLYNYRKGEGMHLAYSGWHEPNRLNSYAVFNTETKELKILHYDCIKAPIYDKSLLIYTLRPGELAIGLKGNSCYYFDHNGYEVRYAGNRLFFNKYTIPGSNINISIDESSLDNPKNNPDKESDFYIENNKIVYNNGAVYISDYILKEKFNNIITCYREVDTKNGHTKHLMGICDCYGNLLSEIKYDEIWVSSNQIIRNKYIRVKINGQFGLISFEGKEILPVIFDFVDDYEGNIAIVNHGKKLIAAGDLSVLYETDGRILENVDGWMTVVKGYCPIIHIGLLDSTGKLYKFYNKRGLWGKMEMYEDLGAAFHDGLLPVFSPKRGYGYVDIDSNEIIECKYCEISDFENGKAKVRLDCEYGYINTKGCLLVDKEGEEIAIPKVYDWAYNYQNGYFVVQKGKLWGAIDEYMHEIIPCSLKTKKDVELTYSKIRLHGMASSQDSYMKRYQDLLPPIRYEENQLFGYKSGNGEMIFPPVLNVENFFEGMAVINIGGRYGYINEKLELVIEPKYSYASKFSEGLALVHEIGKGAVFINKLGETVISNLKRLENIQPFCNGIAKCEYNPCRHGYDNEDYEITKYCIGYKITW